MLGFERELIEQARAETDLDDFGDESFREGLERLVRSVEEESGLNAVGQQVVQGQVLRLLSQRLQVEDWYRRHPEIEEEQIVAPLIGLGLPRTGSTALSALLAEDPAVRFIRNWEGILPVPPPETATEHSDPRIKMSEEMLGGGDKLDPLVRRMVQ